MDNNVDNLIQAVGSLGEMSALYFNAVRQHVDEDTAYQLTSMFIQMMLNREHN